LATIFFNSDLYLLIVNFDENLTVVIDKNAFFSNYFQLLS